MAVILAWPVSATVHRLVPAAEQLMKVPVSIETLRKPTVNSSSAFGTNHQP
jgi:hypothetical protein